MRPLAGLLWAYMGPDPAPELPVWEPFTWKNGFVEVVFCDIPCNWLQCQENSIDPVHFEWMHDTWPSRMKGDTSVTAPKHLKLAFDEFEFGFQYKRIREGMTEADPMWTTGRVALWPNGVLPRRPFRVARAGRQREFAVRVLVLLAACRASMGAYEQKRIPTWYGPIKGPDGRWITSHVINQDIIGWVGQGTIADRTKEKLGMSDVGITKMRQRLFTDLDAIAHGRDPSGIIRDADRAKCVALPIAVPGNCIATACRSPK